MAPRPELAHPSFPLVQKQNLGAPQRLPGTFRWSLKSRMAGGAGDFLLYSWAALIQLFWGRRSKERTLFSHANSNPHSASSSSSTHYCPFALDCISWWGKKDLADQQQQLPRRNEEALNEQADFPEQPECFLQPALLVTWRSCPLPTSTGYKGLTWQCPN